MFWNKKNIKVAVHSGKFHADDVFSVATFCIYKGISTDKLDIIRTRDEEKIKKADYVFDVGFEHDGERKFDHHQEGWVGKREDGIPYASFGSSWKRFGEEICGDKEVADYIDKKIIESLDAEDNGVTICNHIFEDVFPFTVSDLIHHMNPTDKEGADNIDRYFIKAVDFAVLILKREIVRSKDIVEAKRLAEVQIEKIYNNTEDKRILVLEKELPWKSIINKYSEPLFVISKNFSDGGWRIDAVKDNPKIFKNRKDLPESWAGKQNEDLALISGVKDATFCHIKRFVCAAKTFEGAMEMAKIAVNN
jgi:uncharacterized UPF0160 family protein